MSEWPWRSRPLADFPAMPSVRSKIATAMRVRTLGELYDRSEEAQRLLRRAKSKRSEYSLELISYGNAWSRVWSEAIAASNVMTQSP